MDKNESTLASGLKRKDMDAYKELFYKYHGRLVLFANKFTNDTQVSQDMVQEVFVKLWEKSGSDIKSPKAYLFQAVRNNCLNYHRHTGIKQSVIEELASKINSIEQSMYFDQSNPLQSVLELELEDKIEKLVQSMPDKCQTVYKMSRYEYLKNKQIAKELGISVKMVEKHISKALAILRAGLAEYIGTLIYFLLKLF